MCTKQQKNNFVESFDLAGLFFDVQVHM